MHDMALFVLACMAFLGSARRVITSSQPLQGSPQAVSQEPQKTVDTIEGVSSRWKPWGSPGGDRFLFVLVGVSSRWRPWGLLPALSNTAAGFQAGGPRPQRVNPKAAAQHPQDIRISNGVPRMDAGDGGESEDPVAQVFSKLFKADQGKQIYFGVFQKDVDPSSIPSSDEREALRSEAAASLTNIGMAERDRRRQAGLVMSVLTAGLALGLLANDAPTLSRFAIAPPLFLSYGLLASAQTGL